MVDDEDYELLSQYKWQYHFGYAKTGIKTIRMHRMILNAQPGQEVDHINRNKLDNRRINLRICNRFINNQNIGMRKDNTSGLKGLSFHKSSSRWVSRIQLNGKRFFVGSFKSKGEAIMAHSKAVREYIY